MNASDVAAFLRGEISGRELQGHIAVETDAWSRKLRERGRSAPITLSPSSETIEITQAGARRLIDSLISTELSPASFAYILDAMLLSDNFRWASESLRESMEAVLPLENNQDIDKQRAWRARQELMSMTPK